MRIFPWIEFPWHCCTMWNKLEWLSWFWKSFCEGLSSFNLKGFYYSYAWSCSLCEGRISFSSADSYLCFWLAVHHSVSYFFFLYWSPFPLYARFLILFCIDEVLLINPSVNMFVFGNFNAHYKDWLTYSGRIDRPGELC